MLCTQRDLIAQFHQSCEITPRLDAGPKLIQEVSNGYKIGEAAPLPSFHKTTFATIQRELTEFVRSPKQQTTGHYHSLSLFAIDMLNIEEGSNSKYIRTINTLYRKDISRNPHEASLYFSKYAKYTEVPTGQRLQNI